MSVRRSLWVAAALLLLWGLTLHLLPAFSDVDQPVSPADVAQGKDLYLGNCSSCHGLDAKGGEGSALLQSPAKLGNEGFVKETREGISGTGMPGFPLTEAQVLQIAAYLRSLSNVAAGSGDPVKGKSVFEAKGCAQCHIIRGQGGELGPELTQVGTQRAPADIRTALLAPGTNLPATAALRDRGKWTLYQMFRAVTKDGQTIDGMRVSPANSITLAEDSFDIVLIDAKGNFHSLDKTSLKSLEKETGKSFMPSCKDLSEADLSNLVAYLAGLKGM